MPVDLFALSDLRTPWCLHVAATFRIAEYLAASGETEIEALARAAQCDADALHRVLGHLVSNGVFDQPAPGRFALNDAARQLLDPAVLLGLDLNGIGGRMAHAWSTLPSYVRTGAPAYHERFGLPFWDDLDAHPDVRASFDALIGPAGHGLPDPEFHVTAGWESIRSVVDVGGGTGAMLSEILRVHPHVRGILVDLPATVARCPVTERLTTIGQSFFDALPTGADLYLLRGVLNDWPDPEATEILRRCAEAARSCNGRVVILKSVGPEGEPKTLEIETVLLGGKHRTISEFKKIAGDAGLEIIAAAQRPPSSYFVVECRNIS